MTLARDTSFKRGDLKSAVQREDLWNPDLTENNAWRELELRQAYLGDRWPLRLNGSRLARRRPSPIDLGLYRFMCSFGLGDVDDRDRQLFEEVVGYLIEPIAHRPGLRIGHPASDGMSRSFRDRVSDYVSRAGIVDWEVKEMPLSSDNDLGLDVVTWTGFSDGRGGGLHFLVQVATGYDWQDKLEDIHLPTWHDHIHWGVTPVRVFATPLVISLPEARWIRVLRKGGLMLDRPRLCELAMSVSLPVTLKREVARRARVLAYA